MSTHRFQPPAPERAPGAVARGVRCIVVRDSLNDRHAFEFRASVTSWTTIRAEAHLWADSQPFEAGEMLEVGTSTQADPGLARLDPDIQWWGVCWPDKARVLLGGKKTT